MSFRLDQVEILPLEQYQIDEVLKLAYPKRTRTGDVVAITRQALGTFIGPVHFDIVDPSRDIWRLRSSSTLREHFWQLPLGMVKQFNKVDGIVGVLSFEKEDKKY
jgi:hypothetical protein